VQAATTLHRLDNDDERARDALSTIKQVSQETLVELRSVLGALRQVDEAAPRAPAPTLCRLDELVGRAQEAGVNASIEVEGTPHALPSAVDLAAYRIVQEALTNVARHASTGTAKVHVSYGDNDVVVEVDDDGTSPAVVVPGNGITGMTERAATVGGTLRAAPRPDGGFRVRAWLPLERRS
jgi:signal transduction histidine kinase